MTKALLLAQASDPLSGGAGWIGAGLLGCVLAWLMFVHLPNKDKQMKDIISFFNENRDKMVEAHRQDLQQLNAIFRADFKETRADFVIALKENSNRLRDNTDHMEHLTKGLDKVCKLPSGMTSGEGKMM